MIFNTIFMYVITNINITDIKLFNHRMVCMVAWIVTVHGTVW
jgi:hypothetical protein